MDHNLERDAAEERCNPGPVPLRAPPQPERTARQLAAQLSQGGFRDSAVELLAAQPGLRPHIARLAAGRCEDARKPGMLAARLRQWADEEETWQAAAIADELVMIACAEHPHGICTAAVDLAAEAALASRAIARPMSGQLISRQSCQCIK